MLLYRAMNNQEAEDMLKYNSLSWRSKFKWFGTQEFVTSRVMDGKFNNSKFESTRYSRLFVFEVDDSSLQHFSKCGYREFMLSRKKAPMVRILSIKEITK